jgi:hypothetical protein
MSEEQNTTGAGGVSAPKPSAGGTAAAARRKTPARSGSSSRRARAQGSTPGSLAGAALASQSHAQNPQGDDPFQSGQRIWPD